MRVFGIFVKSLLIMTLSFCVSFVCKFNLHLEAELTELIIYRATHDISHFTADETIDITLAVPAFAADLQLLENTALIPSIERHL